MKQNVGKADKYIRIILGLAIIIAGFTIPQVGWFGLIGIIPIFTAVVNWCPLYTLFGIKTCKASE
ncbi:MAG: DUF2892 domain-containing protein [Ignavibacteriae bacterium]|nr:DUF2892 domain-containing protein [Ignavibacteriota bacterium]MCB0723570.1 DUF2892 domain-containing protein [Ignavibacteriota bacterium]MCB9244385.1 DUF2892 domain-containing protein [Ignavibacteriales bacterium]